MKKKNTTKTKKLAFRPYTLEPPNGVYALLSISIKRLLQKPLK